MSAGRKGAERSKGSRTVTILISLIALGFIGAGVNVYYLVVGASYDQRYLEMTGEMRLYAQKLESATRGAVSGDEASFEELARAQRNFASVRRLFVEGGSDLPSPASMLTNEVAQLNRLWAEVDNSTNILLENRESFVTLFGTFGAVATFSQSIPQMQELFGTVVSSMVADGVPANQVAIVQRQPWVLERAARNIDNMSKMTRDEVAAQSAVDQFTGDAREFGAVVSGLVQGNAALGIDRLRSGKAREAAQAILAGFGQLNSSMGSVLTAVPELMRTTDAAQTIIESTPELMKVTSSLTTEIGKLDERRPLSMVTAVIFVAIILVALSILAMLSFRNTQRRLQVTAETNDRNQTAILRLLDELADLADGDLTTSATVTEDFTGAIADSINYTIDQLRVLVSQINETAQEVSSAAQSSQSTALELAQASDSQAREIAGASAAITEMAQTIDRVSSNARESAAVAQRSVAIANTGSEVVQNTIKGMDNIREQIQETSKRIKRLGESSQEIGDIVSLINDIADQTNILALNAAIQASMAGDAGRGFAVVADEVQRLAERSSGATKQIEALVKTIQSDTNEAVISMEQTTSEVVRGARLAQDAGAALTEIETVSQELAELIENISNAAEDQSRSAGQISSTMKIIQEITSKTSTGSTETAKSIGALAEMTNDLRSSVAGFTLPEQTRS